VKFPEPVIAPNGDRFVLIEFGDDSGLRLNLQARGFAQAVDDAKIPGIIETNPGFNSVLVEYDWRQISYDDLVREALALADDIGTPDEIESRLIHIPTLYLDPWTRECMEEYHRTIKVRPYDPEFIVAENGLADVDALVALHSATEYWIGIIGAYPGLPLMRPLDPRCQIYAPKYDPPRMWTPQGAVVCAGGASAIQTLHSPGGFNMIGRTPIPLLDPEQRIPAFRGRIALLRPGDRIKFDPIDRSEYEQIAAKIVAGSYAYNIIDYQRFSLSAYEAWTASLDITERY
jgi:urea carboxylase